MPTYQKYGAPNNGTSEVQTVTVTGSPGGGTFKLRFRNSTTGNLAYNISAADLQTALRALASINGAHVTVTGSDGGPFTVTFTGDLAKKVQTALRLAANNLTGGTSPSVTIVRTTPGVDATYRNAAQGSLLVDTLNDVFYRNTGTEPVAQWTLAESAIGRLVARATFDPSANTGERTIGAHGLGVTIPDNAIIIGGFIEVLTTFTSATDAATIALHTQSAGDLRAAVAISTGTSWDAGFQAIIPKNNTPESTGIKLTAAREITATVAVEALTAGKCDIFVEYVEGQ
jgi:hypothetical protein